MSAKNTTIEDVIVLPVHTHLKKEQPQTLLRSVQLKNLGINFENSKEIYHIDHSGTPKEVVRGSHAHHTKRELFQILSGTCKIVIKDGRQEKLILLNDPNQVVYMPTMIWHEIVFHEKALLLVISSTMYHENERLLDYIEDYEKFRELKSTL